MEKKRKEACFTTGHTRQVYNCKVTDSKRDLQENGKSMCDYSIKALSERMIRNDESSFAFIMNRYIEERKRGGVQ